MMVIIIQEGSLEEKKWVQKVKYIEFVGPIIRYIREEKGIDAETICMATSISRTNLMDIEGGRCEAIPNTLHRICEALSIDFVSLFRNSEKYEAIYEDGLYSLIYGNVDEQEDLIERCAAYELRKSIMFPKMLLLMFVYESMKDPQASGLEEQIRKLEFFLPVFSAKEKCIYYDFKGYYYLHLRNYNEAIFCYEKAESQPSMEYKEILYFHYGMHYHYLNKSIQAMDYFRKAYSLFEKKWNINCMLKTKAMIGICYTSLEEYSLAEKQLLETLRLAKQYKNSKVIQSVYAILAFTTFLTKSYKVCIEYSNRAFKADCKMEYLDFFLAYSHTKLKNYGEAALYVGKREDCDKSLTTYKLLSYVKKLLDNEEANIFMEDLCVDLKHDQAYELHKFVLKDLANAYHEQERYLEETLCMREMYTF